METGIFESKRKKAPLEVTAKRLKGLELALKRKKELNAIGGRPKGSFGALKRQKIVGQEAMRVMVEKNIDALFEAVYQKAMEGDINAARELFNRAWGRTTETVNVNGNVQMSLLALARRADDLELPAPTPTSFIELEAP